MDSSPVFCGVVRAKALRAKLKVAVHCEDMRDFTLPRPVDLVLAEFASLNNLADRRDLPRVFNTVARALRDGGWFCFDVNTPLALRTQYPQTYWIEDKGSSWCSTEVSRRTGSARGLTSNGSYRQDACGVTCERRFGTSAGLTPRFGERSD